MSHGGLLFGVLGDCDDSDYVFNEDGNHQNYGNGRSPVALRLSLTLSAGQACCGASSG